MNYPEIPNSSNEDKMKKQLISFTSLPEHPTYCEAADCEHLCLIKGCLIGREEWMCAEEAEARGEK